MKRFIAGVAAVTLFIFIFSSGFADEIPLESPPPPPIEEPAPPPRIFFSEIAWMGTAASANDEWIELYNAGGQSIDLSGWFIRNVDESLNVSLSGAIEAGAYFLLERTDDTTVSDIPADLIYTGALKNDGEVLSLVDPLGQAIDEVNGWYAGDNAAKATMERADFTLPGIDSLAWHTNNLSVRNGTDAKGGVINGTPKNPSSADGQAEDPAGDLVEEPVPPVSEPEPVSNPVSPSADPSDEEEPDDASAGYVSSTLINEVMVNPLGNDEQGEWVELYNATGQPVDLSGWYLDDAEGASSPFSIPASTLIASGQYLVFRGPGLKLSFKNSADIVRLLGPDKALKEMVTYSDAKEDFSYARNAEGIFTWDPIHTPGSSNRFPAPPKSYERGAIILLSALANPDGTDAGNEKITLLNRSPVNIDLAGWRIENGQGHSYRFESGSLFSQGERVLLQDEFQFTLKNSSEILRLLDPAGNLIDEMGWAEAPSGQRILNYNFLPDTLNVFVTRVVDGDTFVANFESREITIRLIGVDTPETVHPKKAVETFGKEASDYLKQLLFGKNAILQFDANRTDKYGRLLAYAYSENGFANELIIRQGYGRAYIRYPFRRLDDFLRLQEEAKQAGLGLWGKSEVAELIEQEDEEKPVAEEPQKQVEMAVLPPAEEIAETFHCLSASLKIDSALPNPKKDEGVEYIRLANTGTDTVCLEGWQLDDTMGSGSKPFLIPGGSMEAGAMRTFRKTETKIALNNQNDCAFLIDPAGQIADQICYGKTHQGEVFTHEGGDYKPPLPKTKTTVAKTPSVKRDPVLFAPALPHQTAVGRIQKIDETEEEIYVQLDGGQIIPLAYADSPVDMAMAKSLVDLGNPLVVDYRPGETNQLLGVSLLSVPSGCPTPKSAWFPYSLFGLAVLSHLYFFRRLFLRCP